MNPDKDSISRRTLVARLGAGITGVAITAAVPAEGQTEPENGTDAPFADPTTKYPKPPYPSQSQPWPGLSGKMDPRPDHGETSYKGSGRLAGAQGFDYRRGFRHGPGRCDRVCPRRCRCRHQLLPD